MTEPATMDFGTLVSSIKQIHDCCTAQASKAVNLSLTLRNWVIGFHISEYELHGADRAVYGERLLTELGDRLTQLRLSNCNRRQLYRYLRFYRLYPQIVGTLSPQLAALLPDGTHESERVGTASPQLALPAEQLVRRLSYSHLELLVDLDDDLMRTFYEVECLRGNWSVRELRRQIGSLLYERSGLSKNKEKLAELVQSNAEPAEPQLAIRDPYVFEFLELKPTEVMGESDLEEALLDKLQDFLLELGHGFCFEARQKRLLIGETYGFVDLVFYHRILKCHILVDLKVAEFSHEHLGQLNTYVSWYKRNMRAADDNPPVGLLLCTRKDQTLAEYALADMDNRLFVSKYQLALPSREELQQFLARQLAEVTG